MVGLEFRLHPRWLNISLVLGSAVVFGGQFIPGLGDLWRFTKGLFENNDNAAADPSSPSRRRGRSAAS